MKIINNRVICKCGKDLGEFESDKTFSCNHITRKGEIIRGETIISSWKNVHTSLSYEDVFPNIEKTDKIDFQKEVNKK